MARNDESAVSVRRVVRRALSALRYNADTAVHAFVARGRTVTDRCIKSARITGKHLYKTAHRAVDRSAIAI